MALGAEHGFVKKNDDIEDNEEVGDVRGAEARRVIAKRNHARWGD